MTRRKLLSSVFAAGAVSATYPFYLEPRWLRLVQQPVRLPRSSFRTPVRIVHMSDLHASFPGSMGMIDRAVSVALEQKPDLICLTGDFITHGSDFDAVAYGPILRKLSAAAPTYATLGNHDGGGWTSSGRGSRDHRVVDRLLEDAGIELLHNRSVGIEAGGQGLTLAGVGDLWNGEIHGARAFAGVDAGHPVILMSHNPDSKDTLRRWPWDLMLSGHTHGGQVLLPFLGTRFAPVRDMRYVAGLKPWESRQIHVTRGVGAIAGVRFRCRPEVSLLLLQ